MLCGGLLQHEPQRGWWTARGLVASAVASSALMAVGAVSFLHGSGLRTTNNFLQLQESGCLMQGALDGLGVGVFPAFRWSSLTLWLLICLFRLVFGRS